MMMMTNPYTQGARFTAWTIDNLLPMQGSSGGFSNSAPLGQVYLYRPESFSLFRSQLSHFWTPCPGQKNLMTFFALSLATRSFWNSLSWTEELSHDLIIIIIQSYNCLFFILPPLR